MPFPAISLNTPPGVKILDSTCQVGFLEEINPVSVTVQADCMGKNKDNTDNTGFKAIIPRITSQHSVLWNPRTILPTIWVCISIWYVRNNRLILQ